VKDGEVVLEEWFRGHTPDSTHAMFSVSKTFTSIAVGLAVADGKLSLDDKLTCWFADRISEDNPCDATVRDLLMMAGGHDTDPTELIGYIDREHHYKLVVNEGADLVGTFFSHPFVHKPGTHFCYNSLGTYILSVIVRKVTGESVLDYLTPRLFEPLGIDKPVWEADEAGVNYGGWGLYLKTEDMAKVGQLLLQKGRWGNRQLIPEEWVEEMGKAHIDCCPAGLTIETTEAILGIPDSRNDWRQGYGYQTWISRHNGFRADGAGGQFIIVLPEKNSVIAITGWMAAGQALLDLIWEYIYPYL